MAWALWQETEEHRLLQLYFWRPLMYSFQWSRSMSKLCSIYHFQWTRDTFMVHIRSLLTVVKILPLQTIYMVNVGGFTRRKAKAVRRGKSCGGHIFDALHTAYFGAWLVPAHDNHLVSFLPFWSQLLLLPVCWMGPQTYLTSRTLFSLQVKDLGMLRAYNLMGGTNALFGIIPTITMPAHWTMVSCCSSYPWHLEVGLAWSWFRVEKYEISTVEKSLYERGCKNDARNLLVYITWGAVGGSPQPSTIGKNGSIGSWKAWIEYSHLQTLQSSIWV